MSMSIGTILSDFFCGIGLSVYDEGDAVSIIGTYLLYILSI